MKSLSSDCSLCVYCWYVYTVLQSTCCTVQCTHTVFTPHVVQFFPTRNILSNYIIQINISAVQYKRVNIFFMLACMPRTNKFFISQVQQKLMRKYWLPRAGSAFVNKSVITYFNRFPSLFKRQIYCKSVGAVCAMGQSEPKNIYQ